MDPIGLHVMQAASSSVSTWSKVGYVVGAVGLGIAILRYFRERVEQRRVRPVVIAHEDRRRHISERRFVATAYLTNESSASAFNIRFGVTIGNAEAAWKHDPADLEPSRLNVLRPGERWPQAANVTEIVLADELVFATGGDPDEGRSYWARYQSPSGEWWYTSNPVARSDDLVVKRVRTRRWTALQQSFRLKRQSHKGKKAIGNVQQELREVLVLQERQEPSEDNPPAGPDSGG
jgi:hypothetical protein